MATYRPGAVLNLPLAASFPPAGPSKRELAVSISRRAFLQYTASVSAAALGLAHMKSAAADRPPNIVFILGDDLGWGDLACYGHPHIKTPNLDQLAREGTLFTQGYVNSPVCSPTRAAFMTGRFPARLGIHGHFATPEINQQRGMPQFMDPAVPTITRLFQGAGYKVGHYGKWHLGGGESGDPTAPEPGAYGIDEHMVFNGNGPGWKQGPAFHPRSSELIVDETIAFIERHQSRPFFVQTWLKEPHALLAPTPGQRAPYEKDFAGALQTYYAAVTNLDAHLGRLFARLQELGLDQNTLLLFSSDNGPEDIAVKNASHSGVGSAGPFRGRKRSLYEGGIRVPLIARWPGHTPAGAVNDLTAFSSVDLLPTLCRLAGIISPEASALDGEDLSAALLGGEAQRTKPMYWEFRSEIIGHVWNRSPMLALRDRNYKLLLNPDGSRIELYDIVADPRELNNLIENKRQMANTLQAQALTLYEQMPKSTIYPSVGKDTYPWPKASTPPPEAPEPAPPSAEMDA
jgi:arylsulfatase A-like enzyme